MLSYQSPYYGSPVYASPVGFWDSVGNFMGNMGNAWQGASDAPMYADPGGLPYATTQGVQNAGSAAVQAGKNIAQGITSPVLGFLEGVARSGGVVLGVAIIGIALINESRGRG